MKKQKQQTDVIVQITDLCKKYKGADKFAITNINMECRAGEIVGLLGKNSRRFLHDVRMVGLQGKIGVEFFVGHRDHAVLFGHIHHLASGNMLDLSKICTWWSFPCLLVYIIRSRIGMSTNDACKISAFAHSLPLMRPRAFFSKRLTWAWLMPISFATSTCVLPER